MPILLLIFAVMVMVGAGDVSNAYGAPKFPQPTKDPISIKGADVPPRTWGVLVSKSVILCDKPETLADYNKRMGGHFLNGRADLVTGPPQGCIFAGRDGIEVQVMKGWRDPDSGYLYACVRTAHLPECAWVENIGVETKAAYHSDHPGR